MRKEVNYTNNLFLAVKLLVNNSKLFIPDIIFGITALVLGFLFIYFNGLLVALYDQSQLESLIRSFMSHTPTLIRLGISFLVILIISLLLGLGTACVRYSMVRAAVMKEKVSFWKAAKEGKNYFWRIFGIRIILSLITFIPILILALIFIGLASLFEGSSLIIVSVLLVMFGFALVMAYLFYINSLFVFTYPTLFMKTKSGVFKTLRESYSYFCANKKKAFITYLILFVVNLAFGIFGVGITNISPTSFGTVFIVAAVIFYLLKTLIGIAIKLWGDLFVFENY